MNTILVVEDDADIRRNLVEFLEMEGYGTLTATNGQEALDLLSQVPVLPRAIILDLAMPVMDGCGFRMEQRKDPRIASIPVVLVSAVNDIEPKVMQLGRITFLRKPVDIDDLARVLREVVTEPAEVSVVPLKRDAQTEEGHPSTDAGHL